MSTMSYGEDTELIRGFPDSKSTVCLLVPCNKKLTLHFYDSAVLSTLKTTVTLMVTNNNLTYVCQVPLVKNITDPGKSLNSNTRVSTSVKEYSYTGSTILYFY